MKLIEQSHSIISLPDNLLSTIEEAGRTCYKSEDKITPDSAEKFVKTLIKSGHHAMIEFGDIIVRCITDRGVTHEIVRHRLCSFAQESTRYVKYDNNMEFIIPVWFPTSSTDQQVLFRNSLVMAEESYKYLRNSGWRAEQARQVLPNALKTEIVIKANIREWRHMMTLRTSPKAHPQIRALFKDILDNFKVQIPVVFEDLG